MAIKDGRSVTLWSRNQKNLTARLSGIVESIRSLSAKRVVIDGEVTAFGADGLPLFERVQQRSHEAVLMSFDLLHLDGEDLLSRPIEERRARLQEAIRGTGVLFSGEIVEQPGKLLTKARKKGLEGIVAKRRGSVYSSTGRPSADWVKVKLRREQEFVVGGYLPPAGAPAGLVVGYYDKMGLKFASCVKNGMPGTDRELGRDLRAAEIGECPFAEVRRGRGGSFGEGMSEEDFARVRWVQPLVVVQVRFTEWTSRGLLRQASYRGRRFDKNPSDVRREIPPRPGGS